MRSAAGPRIGFLSSPVGAPFRAQGGACSEESQRPESRAGPCGLDPGGQWRGRSVGSLIPRSTAASALASVGHRGPALTAVRGSPGLLGAQSRAGTALPHRLSRLCGPRVTGCRGESPSMDTREAPSPCQEAWNKGCPSPEDVSDTSCSLGSGPQAPSVPASSQDVFTSSFSFIRLSLGSAGERGEAEGCPPSREAEGPRQSLEEMEAKAASSDGPHDHPRLLSLPFTLKASQSLADAAQTSGGSPGLECQTLPLLDTDAASSCSLDPLWFEASSPGDAHRWDPLLSKCEPALLHCLQGQRRRLENTSSSLEELQVLQHLPLCSLPTSAPSKISATYLHFKNPSFDPSQAEVALVVKNPLTHAGDAGDLGLIRGSERSPGGGHGNPLQYSWWRIPWTEEPGESIGYPRLSSLALFCIWEDARECRFCFRWRKRLPTTIELSLMREALLFPSCLSLQRLGFYFLNFVFLLKYTFPVILWNIMTTYENRLCILCYLEIATKGHYQGLGKDAFSLDKPFSYDKPRQHIKSRDITLLTKVRLVKAIVFPLVMYGCESWTIKKAEHRRILMLLDFPGKICTCHVDQLKDKCDWSFIHAVINLEITCLLLRVQHLMIGLEAVLVGVG
ncbi:hypothetical protein FD755_006176 [Muntiacus reevesi]|uniref:Uncharacterized protein n=1 Tax=Muntiacus reevesi TaxID=9886 RepID=A0A5J5MVW8_MUNRE|nr:hypothetical protein FD755_006176 [Muntiacus reevesi]